MDGVSECWAFPSKDLGHLNALNLLIRVRSLDICHAMSLDPKVDRTLPGQVRYRVVVTILVAWLLGVRLETHPHSLVACNTLSEILSFKGKLISAKSLTLNILLMTRVLIKGVSRHLIIKRHPISLSR